MEAPRTFAEKLSVVLKDRNMGHRTLARRIDPDNVETVRRSIYKWMTGQHTPTQASRDIVTDALGLEPGSLDPETDDDSLMRVLLAGLRQEPNAAARLRELLREANAA
jgi:hypothetical protein